MPAEPLAQVLLGLGQRRITSVIWPTVRSSCFWRSISGKGNDLDLLIIMIEDHLNRVLTLAPAGADVEENTEAA